MSAERNCESGCNEIERKAEQRSVTINQAASASAGIEVRIIAGLGTEGAEVQRLMALRSCTKRQIWFQSASDVPSFFTGKPGVLQGEGKEKHALLQEKV